MWPLDLLLRSRDVLRIGRDAVEWWSSGADDLTLEGRQLLQLPESPAAPALAEALALLFEATSGRERGSIDIVLESAWLPVMLLPADQSLWTTSRLQALLRHRLADLYDGANDPVATWGLRVDHRAGEAQALGYGLAQSIRAAVIEACAAVELRVASVQPALAWGLRQMEPAVRRASDTWWVWAEQDRAIICRLQRGRVTAINAGAPVPSDAAHARRLAEIEAYRYGLEPPSRLTIAAGWPSPVRSVAGVARVGTQPAGAAA